MDTVSKMEEKRDLNVFDTKIAIRVSRHMLMILLMDKILHQLIGSLSHYLQGFIHPRWCRISSINSILMVFSRKEEGFFHGVAARLNRCPLSPTTAKSKWQQGMAKTLGNDWPW